jgi:cell fate (sporulation/competence/biofilm development) regulator YlbF (YheA/YmcA/DUF963 family)
MAVDTQQILDEAAKVGELVAQHPVVARYKQARKAVEEDAEATRLLAEMDRQVDALTRQAQSGIPATDAQQNAVEALQNKIISHIKIKAFNLAQVEFVDLLRKISQTIQRPLAEAPVGRLAAGPGPSASHAGGLR